MRTSFLRQVESHRLLVNALALLMVVSAVVCSAHGGLLEQVERAITTADLGAAVVGVSIREAGSTADGPGDALVSIRGDEPFIPASNMKLITSGAALVALGPGFNFRTTMWWDDAARALIVRGDGDPAFADPELLDLMTTRDGRPLDVEAFLAIWINAVKQAGLKRMDTVIIDDRIFDRQFVDPQWEQDDLIKHYGAQVSGFMFHTNVLHFYPRSVPGSAGGPDMSIMRPLAPWVQVRNRATCRTDSESANTVWIARVLGSNDFTVFGNVKRTMRDPVRVTVHDMPLFFAELLGNRLRDRGVKIAAHRTADRAELIDYTALRQIGPTISTPLSTVLTRCNRDSQNLYAESLLKRTAHQLTNQPGSWTSGGSLIRHLVYKRVSNPRLASSLIVGDGSGLSRDNRISPDLLTAWLASFERDENLRDVFMDSLAIAGRTGTLDDDFLDERRAPLHGATVRAKSGYINGVSCLSGFITKGEQTMMFSVMVNNAPRGRIRAAKHLQERIVSHIAEQMQQSQITLGSD